MGCTALVWLHACSMYILACMAKTKRKMECTSLQPHTAQHTTHYLRSITQHILQMCVVFISLVFLNHQPKNLISLSYSRFYRPPIAPMMIVHTQNTLPFLLCCFTLHAIPSYTTKFVYMCVYVVSLNARSTSSLSLACHYRPARPWYYVF